LTFPKESVFLDEQKPAKASVLVKVRAGARLAPPNVQAVPYLQQGMQHLTDPLYLGFDAALLGALQLAGGNPADGAKTLAFAQSQNHAASGFVSIVNDVQSGNAPAALNDAYTLLEFCNGGPLDHNGADANNYATKANAGALAHRECYSGYYSMHGTEGLLLITGDLHALNGNAPAASAYYNATRGAADYSTWALQPLIDRRLNGKEPASPKEMPYLVQCPTCHTNTLP